MPTPNHYKTRFYPSRRAEITDEASLEHWLQWADLHYSDDDTGSRFEVAYTYYAAADYLRDNKFYKRAADCYHFAGHHLRSVDNLNNAALAYFAGGEAAELSAGAESRIKQLQWAVRSYARATVCFSDIGEAEEASRAYVAQQDARRRLAWAQHRPLVGAFLALLRLTSRYGQSAGRLTATVVLAIVAYGLIYQRLYVTLSEGVRSSWHWWSGLYYAVVITLSFDPTVLETSSSQTKWLAISNVVVAWILLGVGAALVARRVRER